MNIMFAVPAAVASSIVACRSFVSLTQFKTKDLYVHQTGQHMPGSATRVGGAGTQSMMVSGGAAGPRKGNTLAGIAFRGMGAMAEGVDSMGNALETYGTVDSTVYGQNTMPDNDKSGYYSKEHDIEMNAVEAGHQTRVVHSGQLQQARSVESLHDNKASFVPDM